MTEYLNPFIIFVLSLAAAGIGAYLGSYLQAKGKNVATREDIDRVVRKTEDIKAEISGGLWEKQNRWTFKRDIYIRLLENLGVARMALDHLYDMETVYRSTESEVRKKRIADAQERRDSALDEIQRTTAVAALILNTEALAALAKLERDVAEAANAESYFNFVDEQLGAVKEAYEALKIAARADLVLEPRS